MTSPSVIGGINGIDLVDDLVSDFRGFNAGLLGGADEPNKHPQNIRLNMTILFVFDCHIVILIHFYFLSWL
jgi:hypothetical protein